MKAGLYSNALGRIVTLCAAGAVVTCCLGGCAVVAVGSAAVSVVTLPVKLAYHAGAAVVDAVTDDEDAAED